MISVADRRYFLYMHTTPSGKRYIGITSNIVRRWHNGKGYRGTYFARAIRKYGWENIKHEILLYDLTKEDAIRLEREYIKKYRTTDRSKGYNRSLGGEVPANDMADQEEYRLRQSLNSHRQWEDNRGKICRSSPPRNKESKYRKKVYQYDTEWNLIAVHESVAECARAIGTTKMPISDACNGKTKTCKGFFLRFESDKYLSNGKRGSNCARAVVQMDIDWNEIATFDSATEAAKAFGRKSPCTILGACNGKQVTAYGYRWRYKNAVG